MLQKPDLRNENRWDISKAVRKDVRNYNNKWITKIIEESKSMRVLKKNLSKEKTEISKLKKKGG